MCAGLSSSESNTSGGGHEPPPAGGCAAVLLANLAEEPGIADDDQTQNQISAPGEFVLQRIGAYAPTVECETQCFSGALPEN